MSSEEMQSSVVPSGKRRLVRAYKVPLKGAPHFIHIPVVRGDGGDARDLAQLQSAWAFEGLLRKYTKIRSLRCRQPATRFHPFAAPRLRQQNGRVQFRQRMFNVYAMEGLDYDMPYNETVAALKFGPRIRAEFIIMEVTASGKRAADARSAETKKMDYLAVDWGSSAARRMMSLPDLETVVDMSEELQEYYGC
ncbi:hypothetical protein K466DRAFT_565148 [Polyporus arcularius HHB13444]|uniref:Uncharacterized protein n=1 Tax=Polyporus arcularius HHB13444 TaxID=1314778 RepID=A0A5C3PEZ8_9APHY|nr:hypothetical protein K466DRAFT_565148 [Polyporus arcularius HHB13444]